MLYQPVKGGTTGNPVKDAPYYDAPGGNKLGTLKLSEYDIVLVTDNGWYGLLGTGGNIRFARKEDFTNVEVTKIDYNDFVRMMIDDIYAQIMKHFEGGNNEG